MTTGKKIVGTPNDPYYYEKSWSGDNDPGRHKRDNAYNVVIRTHRAASPAKYCARWGCGDCTTVPNLIPSMDDLTQSAIFSDAVAEARFKARSKLTSRIRGHDFDLGNLLGESKQTFGLVGDTLKRITGMAIAAKRGDIAGALRQLGAASKGKTVSGTARKRGSKGLSTRDISSAHLELTYGVVPLLSDVFAAMEAYHVLNSEHPRSTTIKAQAGSARAGVEVSGVPGYYNWEGKLTVGCSLKVRLREELTVPRSLGLLDPVGVAWEVLPWSFVADWFIPIGDYLDQLSVLPHLNTVDVWETLHIVVKNTNDPITKYPYGCSDWSAGYSFSGMGIESKVVRVQRFPASLSAGSLITPRFKPLGKAFSPAHIRNGIALLHQSLSGLKKV